MDDRDLALRNLTYALFVELGRAPAASEPVLSGPDPVPRAGARTPVVRELRVGRLDGLGLTDDFWRLP